ncbi:MAG: hydroxyisourate hydrolase [Myxococcota bacterium]|nr:hydroxyisourate hydrolase [Myxococcota bacterium]
MRSPITTHILDTSSGQPAAGVPVRLDKMDSDWVTLAEGRTDEDGRVGDLLAPGTLSPGVYRVHFDTSAYWASRNCRGFYPYVEVVFEIEQADQHYHVPLLLNPFGYSTYRGS